MRSLQVAMCTLCVLGGLYLLTQAPAFFLPDHWQPAVGRQFDATASRLLGAGLLALAALGGIYLRAMYYGRERRLPGPALQQRYFVLLVLALGLITLAMLSAEPGPNPEYRPRPAAAP